MIPVLSLDASDDTDSRSPEFSTTVVQPFVRQSLQALSSMSDTALQDYINYCAESMMAAHQRWKTTGSFADVGERDSCWLAEADALIERGNRPQLVLKMERERNLCGR
jgi:hypothetical protein